MATSSSDPSDAFGGVAVYRDIVIFAFRVAGEMVCLIEVLKVQPRIAITGDGLSPA